LAIREMFCNPDQGLLHQVIHDLRIGHECVSITTLIPVGLLIISQKMSHEIERHLAEIGIRII
jgi:hypothetical protein